MLVKWPDLEADIVPSFSSELKLAFSIINDLFFD